MPDNDITSVILVGTDGVPYSASGSGVSQADGSPFMPNTSSMVPVGGIYESIPSAVSDGDAGAFGMTANRVLKAALHDASGAAITTLPVSLASTTITGTVAVTQSGTWDEVGINDSGNSITVDNNGTFAVQAAGDVAHDSPDSGNPVKIGGKGVSAAPVAVTAGDRVDQWFGISGAPVMGAFGNAGADGESNTAGFLIGSDGNARSLPVQPRVYNGATWDRMRGTSADGLLVNLGANNDVIMVSSTAAQTSVADNAASVTLLASNANRRGATIFNDSSALLYVLLGSGPATTTTYTARLYSQGYYEVPAGYTGIIVGIWASDPNDGAARITELT